MTNRTLDTTKPDSAETLATGGLQYLKHLKRFGELGQLNASLVHDISNPLTAALLHLEQAQGQQSSGVRQARRDIERLRQYVEAARRQIRQEDTNSNFCIRSQLRQLKPLVLALAHKAGVHFVIDRPPHCQLYGDPIKLQHIMLNLIINALEAYTASNPSNTSQPVRVKLSSTNSRLTIQVIDWGEGIKPANLHKIFESFYTSKKQSELGLGIGLAIVKRYVTDDFHGSIAVASSPLDGTNFTVKLPTTMCTEPHSVPK